MLALLEVFEKPGYGILRSLTINIEFVMLRAFLKPYEIKQSFPTKSIFTFFCAIGGEFIEESVARKTF